MSFIKKAIYKIVCILIVTVFLVGQNEVCFEIQPNPYPNDPALVSFTKYINVLDCIDIYAENQISDDKILHAAAIAAELLDNNEDGLVDDILIENSLRNLNTMMPIFNTEWSSGHENLEYYDGCLGAVLYNNEIDPSQPGHWGDDASVEEILHTINGCGHVEVYPLTFGLDPNSSVMSNAMDIARGGQFLSIPNNYPDQAWYHYDDWTCDYQCMAMEYLYWCIVSEMGILNDLQTCNGIDNEWELCTPYLFESTDTDMYAVITDSDFLIPMYAPDGNYCPNQYEIGDLNQDMLINILDVIIIINFILDDIYNTDADINDDETINVQDIILIINLILN